MISDEADIQSESIRICLKTTDYIVDNTHKFLQCSDSLLFQFIGLQKSLKLSSFEDIGAKLGKRYDLINDELAL